MRVVLEVSPRMNAIPHTKKAMSGSVESLVRDLDARRHSRHLWKRIITESTDCPVLLLQQMMPFFTQGEETPLVWHWPPRGIFGHRAQKDVPFIPIDGQPNEC